MACQEKSVLLDFLKQIHQNKAKQRWFTLLPPIEAAFLWAILVTAGIVDMGEGSVDERTLECKELLPEDRLPEKEPDSQKIVHSEKFIFFLLDLL